MSNNNSNDKNNYDWLKYIFQRLLLFHCKMVNDIIEGHPVFFQALRKFLSRPNKKLTYVIGNHDIPIGQESCLVSGVRGFPTFDGLSFHIKQLDFARNLIPLGACSTRYGDENHKTVKSLAFVIVRYT